VYTYCNIYNFPIYFCNIHMKHLQHSHETSEILEIYSCNMLFQCAMSPCCSNESRSTPPWRMELAGAPLGEDLLGGLGEHLREARKHLLRCLGQRTLGMAEDGYGTAGDGCDGVSKWLDRVSGQVLPLEGGRAPRLAGPAAERRRWQVSRQVSG
jgi:hypothetical protein